MNKKQGIFILFMVLSVTMLFSLFMGFKYEVPFPEAVVVTVMVYIVVIAIAAFLIGLFSFGRILDMLEAENPNQTATLEMEK